MKGEANISRGFEQALSEQGEQLYILRLYVSGSSPKSIEAITNINSICKEHLRGRYELEVVDIYQQPELATEEQVVAAPMLVKKLPPPFRRLIGDLSNTSQTLRSLGLST